MLARRGGLRCAALVALAACARPAAPGPPPPLPREAYARYLDGKLAAYRDEWGAAAAALAAAARAAPDQAMVAVELARAQQKAKRPEAARETLAAARARWPEHAQVWLASGDLLAAAAPEEARAAYRKAIQLDPSDERGFVGLAKLVPPAQAITTLQLLVQRNPDSVDGRFRLGQRLAIARDLSAAIQQFRAVLERDPDHIDARLDLARVLRFSGQLPEAVEQTRSAFDRAGQAIDVAEELFWVLCEADDRTAAIDLLMLLDDDRSDLDALATLARLNRGLGRIDEARRIAARLGKLDADAGALVAAEIDVAAGDPLAGAKRALGVAATAKQSPEERSESAAGDPPGAARAAGALPRAIDARRIAAAAYLAAGDPGRAREAIAPALAQHGTRAEVAAVAAFALVELGEHKEAMAVATRIAEPGRTFLLARIADQVGQRAAAIALVEPLARAQTEQLAALNLAGYLLADRGERLADAEVYLRRARELAPGDSAVLDSWGWLLYRRGRYRDAVRALDRAARFSPREPEILVHLAAAWAADGAPKTAAAVLDRAAALRPPPAIQKRLDDVRARVIRCGADVKLCR